MLFQWCGRHFGLDAFDGSGGPLGSISGRIGRSVAKTKKTTMMEQEEFSSNQIQEPDALETLPNPWWGEGFRNYPISEITIAAPARTLLQMRFPFM